MGSILTSVKKMCGIPEEYEHFDLDMVMHINSVFAVLNQLGVGPSEGFTISDKSTDWSEFTEDNAVLSMVESYVGLKVRLIFDPPTSSAVTESINKLVSEFEWRLNVAVDPPNE